MRDELDMHWYQDDAVAFMLRVAFACLWIDLGLGKTIICLTFLIYWLREHPDDRVLVVAPLRVATQTWPNEIPEWEHTCDSLGLDYTVIRAEDDEQLVREAGSAAEKARRQAINDDDRANAQIAKMVALRAATDAEAIKKALKADTRYLNGLVRQAGQQAAQAKKDELRQVRMNEPTRLHIINKEQISWLVEQHSTWVKNRKRRQPQLKVETWPYNVVILDESDGFQDHASNRFRFMKACREQGFIDRLYALTATPAADSYMGLFAQVYLVDLGQRLGRNITAYRDQYFHLHPYKQHVWELNSDAKEKIAEKLSDICLVMEADAYLPRDRAVILPRRLRLPKEQLDKYKRFERQFVYELPSGDLIEAETGGALHGKLVQLSSGALYDAAGKTHFIHDVVAEDLEQLVEELHGSPLMVAYWYQSSLERLRKQFRQAVVMDKAGRRVTDWNAGRIPIFLCHPASMGHGLNMQLGEGHDLYYFDACVSNKLFTQLNGRIDRQGAKHRARIHLPTVAGTAHDDVYDTNGLKQNAQEFLKRRVRRIWDDAHGKP